LRLEWNRDGVMHSESGVDELVRETLDDSDRDKDKGAYVKCGPHWPPVAALTIPSPNPTLPAGGLFT